TGLFASPRLVALTGVGQAGLFYGAGWHQLGVQLLGLLGAAAYVLVVSWLILRVMKATMGLRVPEEDEIVGLDLSEHGTYGYPEQLPAAGSATKIGAVT
ncbi:MAG TPA: ammonium transporter, partial [Limnochordia bacterium]